MNRQELEARVIQLARAAKLDGWNAFVDELQVPSELYPALVTMRVELLKCVPPRQLIASETAALYNLIGGLIETNIALRSHAAQVAELVQDWVGSIRGLISTSEKINYFAQFKHDDAAAPGEMEDA